MENYAMGIITLGVFYIYQITILEYAGKVLIKGSQNLLTFYLLAFINTALFVGYMHLDIPLYFLYALILIVLGIEFKLISKSKLIQSFCGSAIFTMNIAAVNILVISIFSFALKVSPFTLYSHPEYGFLVVFLTCFSLSVFVQPIVIKFFNPQQIQQITSLPKYSVMLLASIIAAIIYASLYVKLILTDVYFEEQLLLSITTSFFILGGFYFLFSYGVSLTSVSFYQRKTDASKIERLHLEDAKAMLDKKIEKDSLTGVYSRKYAMELLEDLTTMEFTNFSILYVDVNALKFTNDAYGHEAGDRLIVNVSTALSDAVRENDIVARLGGDEFVVIAVGDSEGIAESILSRFHENISEINEKEEFLVSASVGTVFVDTVLKNQGVDSILSLADTNMRQNKESFYSHERGNS